MRKNLRGFRENLKHKIRTIDGNNDLSNQVMTSSRPSSAIDPKFFHDTSIVLMSPVSSSRRTSIEVGASVRVPGETPDASPIKAITKGQW